MSGPLIATALEPGAPEGIESRRRTSLARLAPGGDLTLAFVRVSNIVLTAASSAVVARSLGPHGYGIFAQGASVASLLILGKTYGADALYLRGSIDERELQRRSLMAGLLTLVLTGAGALLWPGLSETARECAGVMGLAWAIGIARTPWPVVPARQLRFAARARREAIGNVLSLGSVMVLAATIRRPLPAAAGLLAGAIITALASWAATRREVRQAPTSSTTAPLRDGLTFTALDALFVAYFTVDGAMIAALRPAVDAGMYRVAYAFVIAAAVLPVALNSDVLRVRLWQLAGEERRRALHRAIKLTAVAGITVTIAFEALGGVGERLFFGSQFVAAIPIIRLLGAAMPFHYANSLWSNINIGAGRISLVLKIQALMLVTNVVGNVILIPSHGPSAAALMTAITEAVGCAAYAVISRATRATQH